MNRSAMLVLTAVVILVASVINYRTHTVDQPVVVIAAGVGLVCLLGAALSSRFLRTRLIKPSAFTTGEIIRLAVAVLIGVALGHAICQFAYPSASAQFRLAIDLLTFVVAVVFLFAACRTSDRSRRFTV